MATDPSNPDMPPDAGPPLGRRELPRVLWMLIGGGLLFALIVVWLMPLSTRVNVYQWATYMLGLSPKSPEHMFWWFEKRPLGMLMPQSLASVLPAALGLLSLSALAASLRQHRWRAAMLVVGYVAAAMRIGLPLPAYLRAAASGEANLPRRRMLRMAGALENGQSVGHALADAAGELPPLLIDRVTAAEQSAVLAQSLDTIIDRERRRVIDTHPGMPSRAYAMIVVSTIAGVAWLLMIFVLPKFTQIFADFKIQLPPVTRALAFAMGSPIQSYSAYGGTGAGRLPSANRPVLPASPMMDGLEAIIPVLWSVVLLILSVSLLLLLARATRGLFTSRPQRPLLAGLHDRLAWHAPVWGRLTRNRQTAVACDALAEALLAGQAMPQAIEIATMPSLNRVLRNKMASWQAAVEAGRPLAAAARDARMPPLLCDLLAGAQNDAAGAVIFAGRAYAAASGRLAAVLSAVAPVVVTGVLAVFVAFLALALLVPLIPLVDSLS